MLLLMPLLFLEAIILAIVLVVRMRQTLLNPQGTAAYAYDMSCIERRADCAGNKCPPRLCQTTPCL